jgi:hypothetical protein
MNSCTKEVKIDIPGFEQQLVVDGSIEEGLPPVILLSKSNDIYSPTTLEAYVNNFISGASVTVSNGSTAVVLDELCTDNLPPGSESLAAQLFGIPENDLTKFHLCAYTTLNPAMRGKTGKTYNLTIAYNGKTYSSTTTILEPTAPESVYFKTAGNLEDKGYAWAKLKDPKNQYDAYKIQYKFPSDPFYTLIRNPYYDDTFFDGLTFDFSFDDKKSYDDPSVPDKDKGYFNLGDTVIIKLSKLDRKAYEFFEKKEFKEKMVRFFISNPSVLNQLRL